MNQARNRTAGKTLLLRIASNLYIKMAALGWPFSRNTGIKVTSAEVASPTNRASPAHVIRPLLWLAMQFARESIWIFGFRGSYIREYDLGWIHLQHTRIVVAIPCWNFFIVFTCTHPWSNYPKGFKNNCHAHSLHVKILDWPLSRFERERSATCLRDHFAQ